MMLLGKSIQETCLGEIDLEIHICTILMRTVRFEHGQCIELCSEKDDCPIMLEIKRQEDSK